MALRMTTSQTVGPFFHIGLGHLTTSEIVIPGASADQRITVEGRVIDGNGRPVADAVLEFWQADGEGRYDHPHAPRPERPFHGFARVPTDDTGSFRLRTAKPGPVPGPGGTLQAPHLLVSVFMRGLLKRLCTRVYFAGDPRLATCPILTLVPAERRATLVAMPTVNDPSRLIWNVHLQGDAETVFFDL